MASASASASALVWLRWASENQLAGDVKFRLLLPVVAVVVAAVVAVAAAAVVVAVVAGKNFTFSLSIVTARPTSLRTETSHLKSIWH